MSGNRLAGKRALVTSATSFMGPAIVELFEAEGATVVADDSMLIEPDEAAHHFDEQAFTCCSRSDNAEASPWRDVERDVAQ